MLAAFTITLMQGASSHAKCCVLVAALFSIPTISILWPVIWLDAPLRVALSGGQTKFSHAPKSSSGTPIDTSAVNFEAAPAIAQADQSRRNSCSRGWAAQVSVFHCWPSSRCCDWDCTRWIHGYGLVLPWLSRLLFSNHGVGLSRRISNGSRRRHVWSTIWNRSSVSVSYTAASTKPSLPRLGGSGRYADNHDSYIRSWLP